MTTIPIEDLARELHVDARPFDWLGNLPPKDYFPSELHELFDEYEQSADELREIRAEIEYPEGEILAARERDRQALADAVENGTAHELDFGQHERETIKRLTIAKAKCGPAGKRLLNALSAIRNSIELAEVQAKVNARVAELEDLAAPHKRALSDIGQHEQAALAVFTFIDDLRFQVRYDVPAHLPTLPKKPTRTRTTKENAHG